MNAREALTKLRDWVFYEADVEPEPGGGYSFTEGRANPAHVVVEIDRMLAELPEAEPVTDAGSAVVEELLATLGLHPDTDLETVRSHIDSVRAEARCSADARQMGRDEERARAQALADAVDTHIRELVKHWQPAPFMDGSRHVPPSIERRLQWLENALAAWKSGGAK